MASATDILVVGGYGVVGGRIAAHLAPRFPARVLVAGRDDQRASALCRQLSEGTRPRRVNANDPASIEVALEGVGTVVMCVAQRDRHLLRASIDRGLAYTDIAPALAFWQGAENLNADARRTGARVLLGAGLTPGISNMMAQRLVKSLGQVERIETAILLSLGDEYGPDSLSYILEEATQPWQVVEDGRSREVLSFTEGKRVQFPAPLGSRTAYPLSLVRRRLLPEDARSEDRARAFRTGSTLGCAALFRFTWQPRTQLVRKLGPAFETSWPDRNAPAPLR